MKARSVDEPRDDLVDVVLGSDVLRYEGVEIGGIVRRRLGHDPVVEAPVRGALELRDDLAGDRARVRVGEGEVIGHAGDGGVKVRTAQPLRAYLDARGGVGGPT